MAEKKTVMKLEVDLQCPSCYRKIKKILCKIDQISDRFFDEKTNTVVITVICCSPEKIRDKLLCKGGKIIKSIEIKEPPKPKDDKPKEAPKPKEDKPKEASKPKEEKPKEEKPKDAPKPKPAEQKQAEKPKESEKPKPVEADGKGNAPPPVAAEKPKDDPKPGPPKNPTPAPTPGAIPVGLPPVHPVNTCCGPCYEGYGGGPCYHGYGFPPPAPQACYEGNYGPGYVYGRPCYVTRCDYFSEENSTGCTIM